MWMDDPMVYWLSDFSQRFSLSLSLDFYCFARQDNSRKVLVYYQRALSHYIAERKRYIYIYIVDDANVYCYNEYYTWFIDGKMSSILLLPWF